MKTNHQIIDFFTIPTFLIKKNSFEIVYYNNNGLVLTHLNEKSILKHKFSDFIDKEFLEVGEFENCSFKINSQTYLSGNLTVQSFNKKNLIVSFWSNSKTDENSNNSSEKDGIKEVFHITKALLELSTDSIFIMQNGIIQYVNSNLLKVSGYKLSELVGVKFTEFVSPKEMKKVNLLYKTRESGDNSPTIYESVAKLRNGNSIDVDVSVFGIIFNGKPSYQVSLKDITKRKIAERKYQNTIDFAPIGFYQTSRDGNFILANNAMANILGFGNKEDLISKNISEFYYSTEEREKLIEKYDTATKSEAINIEIKFRKKDGSPIWVLMTTRAIKDENQNTINYDGFIIDISERKKKENIQKLLLNISKKSFANISLEEYLELIHNELKQIMKADNFYVAMYNKSNDKYFFPYYIDLLEDYNTDSSVYLHNTLTDIVRKSKKGLFVTEEIEKELHKKYQIDVLGEPSNVWLGVPLIDSTNDEAIGVLALQDYKDEKAYDENDLQTLEIIASNAGFFIERVKYQEKLRLAKISAEEGEKRYKSLFYDNKSVMILIDPKTGNIVDANKSACDFYGYSYKQLTALRIQQISTLPEEEVLDEIQKTLNEVLQHFYLKHKLANGEIKDVEIYSGKVTISGNDLLYSIVHDVSKRKLAEEKVLKLSTSIEQSPISVVITDLNGVIEYVNPYYSELSGYDLNELVGNNSNILNSGIQSKIFYKELWDTILAGNKWQGKMCNKKKNGEIFWESAIISPIKNKDGEIINFVGIKEDITEKIEIEKKLKFLADSLEQVGECVSITDKDDILLYINNSFCKTYGYTKDELIGKHINIVQPTEIKQTQVKEIFPKTAKGGWKGELINKRKDGSLLPIYLSTSVIEDDKHNQIAFIGIAMDITEMKKNSNELIAAKEKAEESDRLKSAFLANMSHEIRTPMNGILGFTNLLLEPDLSDDTKEAYIQIIHQSGDRMLNTVTDIVEISKIEAKIVEVKNSIINVNESLDSIVNFFQPQAQEKRLILSFDKKISKTNLNINIDKRKFESILTNLIKNSIKYTYKGKITVSYNINIGYIEFCIKDTGIGVPENRQHAIFNRFVQADISDTRAFEGSGLGLAIAKSYVEMLGGKIWVESVEGVGSSFFFTIPTFAETKETLFKLKAENKNTDINLLSHIKLLIVEDDEASALFLKTILKNIVEKIILVQTGEQAIEQCKTNVDFDMILMDIKMSGIDGFETTRRIRKFNKEIIIIAQTAYAMQGDREKAISSGCNDYISKPIRKNVLLKKFGQNLKPNK